MKKDNKISKTFRLNRKTVGMLEQFAREEGITQTEAIERAIKQMTRQGNAPATSQEVAALGLLIEQGFRTTKEAIENQPIAALEAAEENKKRRGWVSRLFG